MKPKTLAALVAAVLLAVPLLAQDGLTGHWEGTIELPGQKMGVNLDFTREGEAWKGDISIPLQNARDRVRFEDEGGKVSAMSLDLHGLATSGRLAVRVRPWSSVVVRATRTAPPPRSASSGAAGPCGP